MAVSTPHPSPERYAFESQIRECFGRCAYTHKTHEKMAERLSSFSKRIKWAQIILSAVTTAGIIGIFFTKDSMAFTYGTAIVSVFNLVLSSYVKDEDTGELAQKHREIASDVWDVREDYLSLLTDIKDQGVTIDALRVKRDALQANLHKIYRRAPHTDAKAYANAQGALKHNEDLTFSEKEIDDFLPKPLKRLPA